MISDPIDIEVAQLCGEFYTPPDLFSPEEPVDDDGLGCLRGAINGLIIMAAIFAVLFACAWIVRWLER